MGKGFKILIAFLSAFLVPAAVQGQTDGQLTQYFAVPGYYNPAAVGLADYVNIRVGGRMQWVGIENAPRDFYALADMPLKLFGKKRLGVGVIAQFQSAGLFRNNVIGVQAGYKLKLFKGELTAGVRLAYASETFRGSELYLPDNDDAHEGQDEALPTQDVSGSAFSMGVGVWYTHKWFWAGVSSTHVNQPTIGFGDDTGSSTGSSESGSNKKNYEIELRRSIYFMAGSNIPIKNTLFEVMPSVMVKSDFTTWRAEVTGRVRYKKFLSAGLGYRFDDGIMAMLAAEFKGFYVGYSYDYPLTAINKASSGSHEIVAGYALKLDFSEKNKNKHKSIRIM